MFVDLKLVMKCKKIYNHSNLDFIYTKIITAEITVTVSFLVVYI